MFCLYFRCLPLARQERTCLLDKTSGCYEQTHFREHLREQELSEFLTKSFLE